MKKNCKKSSIGNTRITKLTFDQADMKSYSLNDLVTEGLVLFSFSKKFGNSRKTKGHYKNSDSLLQEMTRLFRIKGSCLVSRTVFATCVLQC
jgi:hypothetical protein